MDNLDTNIDNWDVNDILELLELEEDYNSSEIIDKANKLIENAKKNNNIEISNFINNAKDKLLKEVGRNENYGSYKNQASEQLLDWRENQYLPQTNETQAEKITSRFNKVDIFQDGIHSTMKQDRLGISNTFEVPVAQGTINPNLKNIISKTIVIDSKYRPNILPYSGCNISDPAFNTHFSIDLTETLLNVISMQLFSINIPESWNNISVALGNNYFYVKTSTSISRFTISDGYYTVSSLVSELSSILGSDYQISFNEITNKISIENKGDSVIIIWYSLEVDQETGNKNEECYCTNTNFINNNLGWILGFRNLNSDNEEELISVLDSGETVTGEANVNLIGTQYFLLAVDDYQNNRVNSAVVGIGKLNTKLDLPEYTSADNLGCVDGSAFYVETAPRRLTQAQLYTINTINENRKEDKTRLRAPTTNDILSVIPIKKSSQSIIDETGTRKEVSIPNSNSLLSYIGLDIFEPREYFGPVDIERLNIALFDDAGNLVDLNGVDWSFTLKVKQLYQY